MEDSNGSKPFLVTSSLSFQVNAPSFYNQPKKFASVAPPRPKGLSNQSQPPTFTSSVASTATVGRVGEIPPHPSSIHDDFPPPPPPVDAELPAPPPECQLTPPATEAPPPAFPPPPSIAEDFSLPALPEDVSFVPSDSSPAPPPPPPPPPAPPLPVPGNGVSLQKSMEKQTSFDQQLDSLTDMLSEMETRRPFHPKVSSQLTSVSAPKPPAPPPTAPKPVSFLPPPELQDRPPPAPWAEELRARTTLRQGGTSTASAPAPVASLSKGPTATPKTTFTPSQPASNFSPKPVNTVSSSAPRGPSLAPKVTSHISFPPPPAVPPGPPPPPVSAPAPAPALTVINAKDSFPVKQEKTFPPPASPQPKPAPSPTSTASPYNKPMASPTPPKAAQPKGPGAGAPPGGVPLSMREVEELEKMTNDFIKDMDSHAPVIISAPTEVCGNCGEALSRSQPAVRAMDKLFHSHCFCCLTCQRPLQGMQFYDRDGTPECEECYVNSLAVCSRCGERITDRVLKAVGQCFHAQCFRCTSCSCTLEGSPFITDDNNNPYCVRDYHRRFSPLCVSCNEPIVPEAGSEETLRVVALEKNFHLKCYRCEDCARPLSIEADADGCYPLDGRILCMKCHTKRAKQNMK